MSSSGINNGRIQFVGKSALMKELQRTVAFRAYNSILTSGNSKSAKELQSKVHTLYFGNPRDEDSMGYAEQLCNGMSSFSAMFEKEEDLAKGTIKLVMKNVYHCLQDTIVVSTNRKDKGINMAVLSSKGLNNIAQITARSVWDFGKAVEKNGKKVLALLKDSEYADGKIPSGKTYEDYLLFIREAMYNDFKSDSTAAVATAADDDEDDTSIHSETNGNGDADSATDGMKDSWMFPGYIAFALWGPIMPETLDESYKAEAFWTTDELKKRKSDGRSIIRKEEALKENVARSTASMSDDRGLSNKDYLFAASIAQQSSAASMMEASKTIDRQLKYFNDKVKRAEREVERWRSMLTNDMMMDREHPIMKEFIIATDKFHDAEDELDQYMLRLKVEERKPNPYQMLVDKALLTLNPTEAESYKTPKRQRSETPLSSISETPLSFIDVPLQNKTNANTKSPQLSNDRNMPKEG
jgi:hypothetical protein